MKVKHLVSAMSENYYIWLRAYSSPEKSWHTLLFSDADYMRQLIKSGDRRLDLMVDEWRPVIFDGGIAIEVYAKQRGTVHGRCSTQKPMGRLCQIKNA